jgi:hypothetical protein
MNAGITFNETKFAEKPILTFILALSPKRYAQTTGR